jgi:hypothetical protein
MSTVNIRETLLQEVSCLSFADCPEVLDFIESLKANRQSIQPEKVTKMSREAVFGCMRGQFRMTDDFDAPLADFKWYME